MAFNFLQNKVEKTVKKVKSKGTLSKENIEEFLSQIRLILLESDVNLNVVNNFINSVTDKAIGQIVSADRVASQKILDIVNNELINLLGKEPYEWSHSSPTVVMLVGLQGSGKTTTVAKLANFLVKDKKYSNPLLVGLDIYRPAAIDQLEKLAQSINVDFYANKNSNIVEQIANDAIKKAKENNNDLIILDTAGRLQTDEKLMTELELIKKIVKPNEIIYVIDAMSGQEIANVVKEFNERLKLTSAIISKLDSNAKGGAALSIASLFNIKIMFMGLGEKVNDFEKFYPDRMASRILGLGDIKTLTEKAVEISDESKQEKMMRRILSGQFDLDDLLDSIKSMSKLGNVSMVSKMMPGLKISGSHTESIEKKMKYFEYLISSMTKKEKKVPKLLKHPKRKERILKGSGRTIQEYNELLRHYEKSQKQMKEMAKYIKMGKLPNMGNRFS